MAKTIFLTTLSFILLCCNTPGSGPATVHEGKKLSRIEFPEDSSATIVFAYDDLGDITRIHNSSDTAVYVYTGDSIRISWQDGGTPVALQHYSTDADGRVLTNTVLNPEGELFSETKYLYNSAGQLIRQDRTNMKTMAVFSLIYSYAGDNMSGMQIYRDDDHVDGFYYEYDTTKANAFNLDVNNTVNDFFGNSRTGKLNKHLMKRMYRLSPEGDTTAQVMYTYHLDQDGKVLARTDVDAMYGSITERRFHYSN